LRNLYFDPRTIPLIHSGLCASDAEAILGKAESFLDRLVAEAAIG